MMFINAIVFGVEEQCMNTLKNDTVRNHAISGAVAGFVQCPIVCPTELIKCRMQMQGINSCANTKPEYSNAIQGLAKLYRKEGFRSCFKGWNYTIAREVPSFSAYFATYFGLKKQIGFKDVDSLGQMLSKDFGWSLLCGGVAGCSCWFVSYPFDVLKSRLQIDGFNGPKKYKGSVDAFQQAMRTEGIKWAYRGLFPTLLRAFPVNAVTVSVTMLCKNMLEKYI